MYFLKFGFYFLDWADFGWTYQDLLIIFLCCVGRNGSVERPDVRRSWSKDQHRHWEAGRVGSRQGRRTRRVSPFFVSFAFLKGSVGVISSDFPFIEWHVRFTSISFEPWFDHRYSYLYGGNLSCQEIARVYTSNESLVYTVFSWMFTFSRFLSMYPWFNFVVKSSRSAFHPGIIPRPDTC